MLNLDETLITGKNYNVQRDFFLKIFLYSLAVIVFLDILRNQISEINLLQLVPGFYLILLFLSFLFLIFFSDFSFQISKEIDSRKELGTKTLNKFDFFIKLKLGSFFFSLSLFLLFTLVLPLSFDSFNSYGEKTLENIWSFDEVIALELTLLFLFSIFSQVPILVICFLGNEIDFLVLPEFWKILSFSVFVLAGFLTPTIDGYTQLSFSFSAISFYFLVLNLIEKRINLKLNSISLMNS